MDYLREDQLLFSYLHLAANPELASQLQKIGLTAIAFETLMVDNCATATGTDE